MHSLTDRAGLARALGFLLFGLLLVVADVRINGFDLLPDPLGWLLVAGALRRCREMHRDTIYTARIGAAWLLALVCVALSFVAMPGALGYVAYVVFALPPVFAAAAFARLARVAGDADLAQSWTTSGLGLVSVYVAAVPVAALHVSGLVPVVLLLALAAVVHFALSAVRTRRVCRDQAPIAMDATPARSTALLFVVVAVALVAGSGARHAWAQNFWRPVDPYRASAVRAGMLDWPIRGNRVHDRSWMHDHVYCCQPFDAARVLYAAQTPYGPLTLVESTGPETRPGTSLLVGAVNDGRMVYDLDIPAGADQVSAVVAMRGDHLRTSYLLLVVGAPGTTRIRWRSHEGGPWSDLSPHDGAGWIDLSWMTGWSPNDIVISVERHGRTVYEGTVTALTTGAVWSDPPAPLVSLPPALAATAGDDVDHLAFRFCLVQADALRTGGQGQVPAAYGNLAYVLQKAGRDATAIVAACRKYDAQTRIG